MPGAMFFYRIQVTFAVIWLIDIEAKLSSVNFYGLYCQKQPKDGTQQVLSHIYGHFVWDKIPLLQWLAARCWLRCPMLKQSGKEIFH